MAYEARSKLFVVMDKQGKGENIGTDSLPRREDNGCPDVKVHRYTVTNLTIGDEEYVSVSDTEPVPPPYGRKTLRLMKDWFWILNRIFGNLTHKNTRNEMA